MAEIKALISDETKSAIDKIVQACFNGNAMADNIVYNLDVNFNMVITSDIVHHSYAHWLPLYADKFNDLQKYNNARPVRLPVDGFEQSYTNFIDCFDDILEFLSKDLDGLIVEAIEIAEENRDIRIKISLEEVYTDLTLYIKQAIIWKEKALQYSVHSGVQNFDKDFPKFTKLIKREY